MPLYTHPYKGKYKDYIANWGDDRDCEKYEKEVDEWIGQFNDEQSSFMFELLKKFRMYRGYYYELCIKKLFNKFVAYNPNWNKNARFFEVKKKNNCVNNSDAFFLDFWRFNEIKPYCKTDIGETLQKNPNIQQIVVVDDFAGTGKTIKDYLLKIIDDYKILREKKIVVLLLACTNLAEKLLIDFNSKEKLNIEIIYEKKYDKVFMPNSTTTRTEVDNSKKKYLSICNEYGLKSALGFEETEALIAFEYNTPNNTLGIFWEEISNPNGLTFRGLRARKAYDRFRANSQLRINKHVKPNKHKLDEDCYSYALFSYMCIYSKKRFNKSLIANTLGLTNQQFFARLDFCLLNNYIKNERGKFVEGDKLIKLEFNPSFKKNIKSIAQGLLGYEKPNNEDVQVTKSFNIDLNYISKNF